MRNKVSYEWVFEEYDEHGDIVDPLFSDTLQDALSNVPDIQPHNTYGVALVRSIGNDEDGLINRQYAYIDKDNKLPLEFGEGQKVPYRYHREVGRNY